jgi:hypothetical protein
MNQADKKAAMQLHVNLRLRLFTSVFGGPIEAIPAAEAAFEVPRAGVPRQLDGLCGGRVWQSAVVGTGETNRVSTRFGSAVASVDIYLLPADSFQAD